jgi:hypothetical protein
VRHSSGCLARDNNARACISHGRACISHEHASLAGMHLSLPVHLSGMRLPRARIIYECLSRRLSHGHASHRRALESLKLKRLTRGPAAQSPNRSITLVISGGSVGSVGRVAARGRPFKSTAISQDPKRCASRAKQTAPVAWTSRFRHWSCHTFSCPAGLDAILVRRHRRLLGSLTRI